MHTYMYSSTDILCVCLCIHRRKVKDGARRIVAVYGTWNVGEINRENIQKTKSKDPNPSDLSLISNYR